MEFFRWQFRAFRPIAARTDCEIDGVSYKAGDYINRKNHKMRSLKRAYFHKKIGHPKESFGKPADFGLERTLNKPELKQSEPSIVHRGGPWYDVYLEGEKINDKALTKNDAEELAAS